MHLLPFRATYPDLELIPSPASFLLELKEAYPTPSTRSFYRDADCEAFYVYQIETPYRQYLGIIACALLDDYLEGAIRPHEHTLAVKLDRQLELFRQRQAEIKPVLLTYPEVPSITEWTRQVAEQQAPFLAVRFTSENQWHRLWAVDQPARILELQKAFRRTVPVSYIADGHHRTASLAKMFSSTGDERFRRLLCAFFPSTDLDILPFNRLVSPPSGFDHSRLLEALSGLFDIQVLAIPQLPTRKHELLMLTAQKWYRLQWKASVLAAFRHKVVILDTMLLHLKVFKEVFGLHEGDGDQRVEYIEGPKGTEALLASISADPQKIGFALFPVDLPELMSLVDHGDVLPPKSTWFEPRVRNGLVVLKY